MVRDSSKSLAPGFRFHPTDEELVSYYLHRKVSGKPFRFDPIGVIDVYKSEPWDLPCQSKLKSKDLEWYFFSALDKKYGNGSRTNRATEKGYWKTTGKDRPIKRNSKIVGMKKTLVYHNGRAPSGTRSNWVMHEYKLVEDEARLNKGITPDAFVLCRIFQKSGSGPKNGEQYGAPYFDEEWDEDDKEDQLPAGNDVGNELVAPDDSFLETYDLEQNLDTCVTSEWGPQPLNFYHGDSSYTADCYLRFNGIDEKPAIESDDSCEPVNEVLQQHAMEAKPLAGHIEPVELCYNLSVGVSLIEADPAADSKPVVGSIEILEPYSVQSAGLTPPRAMEANVATDNFVGNASNSENPLSFNFFLDDLYLDVVDEPTGHNFVVDESFLIANDPSNSNKIESPASGDMINEYFACFDTDGDITQYINFDVFESSENPNPMESLPVDEQLMHDQTEVLDAARNPDKEADIDVERLSSKQIAEKVKSGEGIEYLFLKQASQMLGGIHAPPAFASEFPSKDAALPLHNAQASSPVHVTAGIIRIQDITFKGGGTSLTLGKNGGVDIVLWPHLYTFNTSSAAVQLSCLLSGKIALEVWHDWVFIFLWVLILSVSCKIGNFLYTVK